MDQASIDETDVRSVKTRLLALSSLLLVSSLGGCTATPESFWKAVARIDCKTAKKCQEAAWVESGYDSIRDCVDDTLDEASQDDFADLCDDYDRKEARKCLRSGRKAKRSCDIDDLDEDACANVCGNLGRNGSGLTAEERGRAVAEAKFASGEITSEELEDELAEVTLAAELEDELQAEEEALLQEEIDAVFADED